MTSWIFQGNPDKFDIDSYVADNDEILWSVRQKHLVGRMSIGDEVFLWRSKGQQENPAGVVAVCSVIGSPVICSDDRNALKLWRRPPPEKAGLRVRLCIDRRLVAENEVVTQEQIKADSILRNLRILKIANETNYVLNDEESDRLRQFCQSSPRPKSYKDYGEAPNDNAEELQRFAKRVRRGQPKFRQKLLDLYEGRCAISGWHPENALAAAHIAPHCRAGINHSDNGILLRADLHELFDDGLIQIDPDTYIVSVDESLKDTPYSAMNGLILRPRRDGSQPDKRYLRMKHDHIAKYDR